MAIQVSCDARFGRSHRLGVCRGLAVLLLLTVPLAIGTHRSIHHAWWDGTAPWAAR